jgi:hypothetical protein
MGEVVPLVSFHDPVDHVGQASLEGPAGLRRRLALSDLAEVVVLPAAAVGGESERPDLQSGVKRPGWA